MRPVRQLLRMALSRNGAAWMLRRLTHRRKVVHEVTSPITGKIRVVDCGRERCLQLSDGCHSFAFTRGSWREVERECWGVLHRTPFGVASHASVLMCGLGGGTGLHSLRKARPQCDLTVIERDPEIVATAQRWFGIDRVDRLRILTADEADGVSALAREGCRFDLILEDAVFLPTLGDLDRALEMIDRLQALLKPNGSLALNGPIENPASHERVRRFAAALRTRGFEVQATKISQRWSNWIVHCRKAASAR